MQEARAIQSLPPYLFARIEAKIAEAKAQGKDVISLGIGDPDRPTPQHIIDRLVEESAKPANHQYPSSVGLLEYRQAVAQWYELRFGVEVDSKTEIVSLLGSKEGIAHISFCFLNPGEISLVTDPGYPVYNIGAILANGQPYAVPLREENGFLPRFADIPAEIAAKAKMMFINYPNNPTGAVASLEFYEEAVAFAQKHQVLICHDAAYSEVYFGQQPPPSFLQIKGAKEVGIEFHSVSKTYNMTGWRVGWAVGNPKVVEVLGKFKSNVDSGVFQAIQYAAITALAGPQDCVAEMRQVYRERRDVVMAGLHKMGWKLQAPEASIYVWAPVPKGYNSSTFAELVLEQADVIITPGIGYGNYGDGYFRIALTQEKDRLTEALARMYRVLGTVAF